MVRVFYSQKTELQNINELTPKARLLVHGNSISVHNRDNNKVVKIIEKTIYNYLQRLMFSEPYG